MSFLSTSIASFQEGQTYARKACFSTTDQDGHRFRVVHTKKTIFSGESITL
jgi:hypothetical protein